MEFVDGLHAFSGPAFRLVSPAWAPLLHHPAPEFKIRQDKAALHWNHEKIREPFERKVRPFVKSGHENKTVWMLNPYLNSTGVQSGVG